MDRGNSGAVFRWRAGNLVCHAVERAAEDAGNPEADDIFLKRRDYIQPGAAEALERVGKREPGPLGGLFEAAAEGIYMQEGESLQEIWKRQVMNLNTDSGPIPLEQEDLEQLAHLGEHLGYLDVDMQERTLKLYLEQLDLTIDYLRQNQREKCRLYTSLGIMGGMFLVIVMF